jgi:cobalamin biosynthetic protein CobC
MDALLARQGMKARGQCPLFRLIEGQDGAALFERLARHAILSRPFEENSGWLRLGLPGDESAWARLGRALADG